MKRSLRREGMRSADGKLLNAGTSIQKPCRMGCSLPSEEADARAGSTWQPELVRA